MWSNFFLTYGHYLSILLLVSSVFTELFLVKNKLSEKELKRLIKVDSVYGIMAILVVTTGLLRVFLYGKGSEYYFSNWVFNLKFSLFILVGLLSILPTVTFLKMRKNMKGEEPQELPRYHLISLFVKLEFICLLIIPFLAVLMANGIGM